MQKNGPKMPVLTVFLEKTAENSFLNGGAMRLLRLVFFDPPYANTEKSAEEIPPHS